MRKHPLAVGIAAALLCATLGSDPAWAHADRDETLARLDARIAEEPTDPVLWSDRAVHERQRGNFARAHQDLARAIELGLDPTLAKRDRGLIWFDEGRFEDAEASLRAAREQSPDDPPILLAHARALAALERWLEASDTYTRLVELAPNAGPDVQLERIAAVETAGGVESALKAAEAALATLGPAPALEEKALELELRSGQVDAALARLDRMNSGPAQRDILLLRRAEILEEAGRSEEARAAYAQTLVALDSRTPSRRSTPAAKQLESQARDGIARLSRGDVP
jgi:tetratricopeptide (TPR) repeat protein